jgi:hypothetical protein
MLAIALFCQLALLVFCQLLSRIATVVMGMTRLKLSCRRDECKTVTVSATPRDSIT